MTSQLYGQNEVLIWVFIFLCGHKEKGKEKLIILARTTDEILTCMVNSCLAIKLSGRKTGEVQPSKTYLYLSVQEFCACM